MKIIHAATSLFCLLVLAGCDTSSNTVNEVYVFDDENPELLDFYVIDSDGYDSREFTPMIIDPRDNAGIFDVYWFANSFYDYQVYLSLSEQPGPDNATYIIGEDCGLGLDCGDEGSYICQYTEDYYFGCGLSLTEIENNYIDIAELTGADDIVDDLYINFEVCDLEDFYCEVQSVPVQLY